MAKVEMMVGIRWFGLDCLFELSDGLFQITLTGEPNRPYRLYSSSNLLDWIPVQTNSHPSGTVLFTAPTPSGPSLRYYRGETDME